MEGAHLLEGERGTGAAGQEPPACRIVINDAGSRPDRLDAARTGFQKRPRHSASLMLGTSSSAVAAPAETAASARRSGRPHVGPPLSLTGVEQQRCPRRLSACTDPDPGAVRKRSRADLLGAGGARSISRRPGRRAAPFAQEES